MIETETPNLLYDSMFMKAYRCEPTDYTPIWLMRQAGRYMKEYRNIREKVPFLDLCKNAQLAAEVMITAVERIGVDAAIIFSDILLILQPMGMDLEYIKNEGPVLHNPIRSFDQIRNLHEVDPAESLSFVFDVVRSTRAMLQPDIPLIGFAGAPFTVASYMIEGGSSKNYENTKTLMYSEPRAWHDLMSLISSATAKYLNGQVNAGAQALQLFDSWVGCLSPSDYREFVLPYTKSVIDAIVDGTPLIHFGTGTAMLLELMKEAGGQVIGLDFRVELKQAWDRLGQVAVQGNLDPCVLYADYSEIEKRAKHILDQTKGRNGHIFNLGHGILPTMSVDKVAALVDYVHNQSSKL